MGGNPMCSSGADGPGAAWPLKSGAYTPRAVGANFAVGGSVVVCSLPRAETRTGRCPSCARPLTVCRTVLAAKGACRTSVRTGNSRRKLGEPHFECRVGHRRDCTRRDGGNERCAWDGYRAGSEPDTKRWPVPTSYVPRNQGSGIT